MNKEKEDRKGGMNKEKEDRKNRKNGTIEEKEKLIVVLSITPSQR